MLAKDNFFIIQAAALFVKATGICCLLYDYNIEPRFKFKRHFCEFCLILKIAAPYTKKPAARPMPLRKQDKSQAQYNQNAKAERAQNYVYLFLHKNTV